MTRSSDANRLVPSNVPPSPSCTVPADSVGDRAPVTAAFTSAAAGVDRVEGHLTSPATGYQ
jgi:hypothetical protein